MRRNVSRASVAGVRCRLPAQTAVSTVDEPVRPGIATLPRPTGPTRRVRDRTGGAVVKVRPGSVIRGAGVAGACLGSSLTDRSRILFAAYAVAWPLGKPGLQIFVWVPDTDEPWKRGSVPFATAVASWSFAMLVASTALRRTFLPAPVAALLLGGAVVVVDSLLADLGEARKAAKAAESPGAVESADG